MFAFDPVSVLLSVVVVLFLLNAFLDRKGKVYKNFPPGPRALPIIGNIHNMLMRKQKPHLTFQELAEEYGPVYSMQMGPEKIVVLCGYEAVKDALVNYAEEFSERPVIPMMEKVTKGHGLIFSHGENWKVMRRFALSTLRDFGMGKKSIENKINEESNSLVEVFESYKGKPFDNLMIMNAAVANIIVAILLGNRFEYNSPTLLKLMKLINENIRLLSSPLALLYSAYPSVMRWIPGSHKTIFNYAEKTRDFFRESFIKYNEELDLNDQRNLIDAFLVKQKEEKSSAQKFFHNDNLLSLVNTLFGAGMETTSTTLRWGLLLMMKYPEIQKKVQDEIDRVIGSSQPQTEHRKEMPYTDAVIHEIQRFGDISPTGIPHATTQDITFRGYFLPKGTQVIPLLSSVLQDKAYFEKPEEFYPEHFLDSKGNFVKNEAFLPFSAGRRSCAGETLAKMELFIFFTRLMQKFTIQPPPGVKLDVKATYMSQKLCRAIASSPDVEEDGKRLELHLNDPFSSLPSHLPPSCVPLTSVNLLSLSLSHLSFSFYSSLSLSEKYGSVFTIRIGSETIVVLCGYETVKDALVNHAETFAARPKIKLFEEISNGHGVNSRSIEFCSIVFSSGENWKVMRRFTLSTLRDFGMGTKKIENKIYEECDSLIEKFCSFNGKSFDNKSIITAAATNIIVSILLNQRFEYEDPTFLRLLHLMDEKKRHLGSWMSLPCKKGGGLAIHTHFIIILHLVYFLKLYNAFPSLLRWFPGSHKAIFKNVAELENFIKEAFRFQRDRLDTNDQRSLIDAFLVKQQEEKLISEKPSPEIYFHDRNLTKLVTDLLFAGMETVAVTLQWGLLLMMKYPEIQKKLQNEIGDVIGSAQPQTKHRKEMPYTYAVINEIQRFADIAPSNIPHATTQDVTFKGHFIPKAVKILLMLLSRLQNKIRLRLRPGDMLAISLCLLHNVHLRVCSCRRSCAGENLAKIELFLFFTRLLQKFTFQTPPGAELDLTHEVGIATSPKPYLLCAIPRN
ncbi:cytochrome P450 2K4-like [Pelobates cultripes]|uniref:Cytochrome P450 2U1 n=1 Tax=Pelobates cultripes TaxID=61616 RepID=A0AAD1VSG2_PELCU|nr:cytochrome P450 2K4-like [Pelobates cultripes]